MAKTNTPPSIQEWANDSGAHPPPERQNRLRRITLWWSAFSLRTKLLAITTLVVSLMMTGITFFTLNGIQRDAGMNDTRYA